MLTSVTHCCLGWCAKQDQSNNSSSNVIEDPPQNADTDEPAKETMTLWGKIIKNTSVALSNPHHQLGAIVILAILTFFPIFTGMPSIMENSNLRNSVESTSFENTNYATMALGVVYFVDFFIDFVTEKFTQHAYRRYTKHKDVMMDSETLVYIAGCVIVPIVNLPSEGYSRRALLYTCSNQASLILLSGFVSIMCCRFFRKYFPVWVINFGIVLMCGSTMLTPYAINSSVEVNVLRNLVYYGKFLGGGVYILYSLRWIYYEFIVRMMVPVIKHSYAFVINSEAAKRKQHAKDSMYFPIMYAMSAITSLLFIAFVEASTGVSFYDITANGLLWTDLPVVGFQMSMLIVKSQFSKYEVVENVYSFETAQSRVNVYAQAQEAESIDGISPSNIVQRSGRSGRSGHSLSSISLFIHRIRGGDPYASNVDVSVTGAPSPRVYCDTDDGHDLPPRSRRTSKDKVIGQSQNTPLNSSHKWLLEETDGQGEDGGGGSNHKEMNEKRLSWEDRRILSMAAGDIHGSKSSYADCSPPLHQTFYPQLDNGDEKSGDHVMSEEGSENLGESPDVFGFNLPNHRPRPAFHTHSQGPLSSLSQSEAVSGDLESGCGGLASRQRPQGRKEQYQGQHPVFSGNHQVNQQRQAHSQQELIESKLPSQSTPTNTSPSPQIGSSNENTEGHNDSDINHQAAVENDIDDDILTLLSSISLSEARKYHHHGKRSTRNPRIGQELVSRYDSSGVPRYRLLMIDDSGLLAIALRTDNHICDEVKQPYQDHMMHLMLNQRVDEPYDGILVSTKNGDGPAIAQSIRALSATVPIFGITERGHDDTQRFKEVGATSVLHKPFTMNFFLEFLRQMDTLHEMKLQEEAEMMLLNEFGGYIATEGGVSVHRARPSCPLPGEFDV